MAFTQELMGESVEVIEAKNKKMVGIKGIIRDETKKTIRVEYQGSMKTLMKKDITVRVQGRVVVGLALLGSAEERIKK